MLYEGVWDAEALEGEYICRFAVTLEELWSQFSQGKVIYLHTPTHHYDDNNIDTANMYAAIGAMFNEEGLGLSYQVNGFDENGPHFDYDDDYIHPIFKIPLPSTP